MTAASIQVMLLSGSCSSEQHGGDSSDGSQSMLHQDKKAQTTLFAQRALQERRLKPPDQIIACPRCQSLNTKFCYYNNYSLTQPRHFCKNCRRYWTAGGTLRNVPVGGGCRKTKKPPKQPRSNDMTVLSGDPSIVGLRSDGAGSTLHHPYNPSSASTSTGFYEQQYDDATKIALARAQLRAGSSGVGQSTEGNSSSGHVPAFHVTHGSHSSGMSHPPRSFEGPPGSMITLWHQHHPKQEVGVGTVMANGDLSAIFESPSYRAAAAAAAAAGQSGEGQVAYNIDMEAMNNQIEDAHWRLQQAHAQAAAQQAAAQKQAVWGSAGEEEQGQREGRLAVHNVDEKGLMESLRQAKGKSAITVSPSRGHEQGEGAEVNVSRGPSNVPAWQLQQASDGLQSFEPVAQDSTFWSNQSWAPLDMHALNPPANSQML